MKGAVLYGPRDMRFEERATRSIDKPRCRHQDISNLRVRVGPVALSRASAGQRAYADGSRILRHRRGSRQRGAIGQAGAVRHRLVLPPPTTRVRICKAGYQSVVRESRVDAPGASAGAARAAGGRHARVHAGHSVGRHDPEPAGKSDVLGTGWFAAAAANVKPGKTVAVVGDGAVGLLGVLSARQMGAERIIAMSRHARGKR